ncbi:MAG: hypothetical protein HY539_02210 [Deltaproteobacteria bacterium]|nr:hypothetical protein [Deltaproteobacteria bacterium]
MSDEINLIACCRTLWLRRYFILVISLIAPLVTASVLVVLNQKVRYRAEARILPVEEKGQGMVVVLKDPPLEGSQQRGILLSTEELMIILRGYPMVERVLQKIEPELLIHEDQFRGAEHDAKLESLLDMVSINRRPGSPWISIETITRKPVLSADLANTFLDVLDRYLLENRFRFNYVVLSRALPPKGRFFQPVLQRVLLVFLAGLLTAIFLVFVIDFFKEQKKQLS